MDIGDSKMVEMCVKRDPVCRVFREKNQVQWIPFDPNITQTCNTGICVCEIIHRFIPKYRHYDIAYCYIIVPNKSHTLCCRRKEASFFQAF